MATKQHPIPNMTLTDTFVRTARAFNEADTRLVLSQGGTGSSKTYSNLQLFILLAIYASSPILITVMSESMPHIKLGAMRDFINIMGPTLRHDQYNITQSIYDFWPSGGKMEFISSDAPGKVHGPRRDYLFCNEVNYIPKEIYDAAEIRTAKKIVADYNPVGEFYLMQQIGKPGVKFLKSTYLDAIHVLPPAVVKSIESRKLTDPNWWNIYGLGEVGHVEGLVHPGFGTVPELPTSGITAEFYGLDFGFTNDPTVLVKSVISNGEMYSDEIIYQTGLTNNKIAALLEQNGIRKEYDEIFADESEPKSIEEIYQYGYNIKRAPKGRDSIDAGIQHVNQYKQYWTSRSVNCIKENRNYRYVKDKNGAYTNKPVGTWNHGMDARRYGLTGWSDSIKNAPLLSVG